MAFRRNNVVCSCHLADIAGQATQVATKTTATQELGQMSSSILFAKRRRPPQSMTKRWTMKLLSVKYLRQAGMSNEGPNRCGNMRRIIIRIRRWSAFVRQRQPVAPVEYQVILERGIDQFREFEPRQVRTRINSLGVFLVHKWTCGDLESVR